MQEPSSKFFVVVLNGCDFVFFVVFFFFFVVRLFCLFVFFVDSLSKKCRAEQHSCFLFLTQSGTELLSPAVPLADWSYFIGRFSAGVNCCKSIQAVLTMWILWKWRIQSYSSWF